MQFSRVAHFRQRPDRGIMVLSIGWFHSKRVDEGKGDISPIIPVMTAAVLVWVTVRVKPRLRCRRERHLRTAGERRAFTLTQFAQPLSKPTKH
jgi:hypothetical protein